MLEYDEASKKSFKAFFQQPKPKVGRPKKRRRGRPKKAQTTSSACAQTTLKSKEIIDLTGKKKQQLDADVEGTIARAKRAAREAPKRKNWDIGEDKKHRARLADSWLGQNDLYRAGESFKLFCKRNVIPRNTLKRFIELRAKEAFNAAEAKKKRLPPPTRKKRGRPALLSKSVMRHVCEG